jgi:hypothetical protein
VLNMVMVPAEGRAGAADMRNLLKRRVVGDPINRDQTQNLPGRDNSVLPGGTSQFSCGDNSVFPGGTNQSSPRGGPVADI